MIGLLVVQLGLTIAVSGPATAPEYLPLHVARAEGYFTEEGLEVTLRTTRADADAAEALARGRVDLAATSLDAALRHGARGGRPPRLVFGLTAAPPVVLLVATRHREALAGLADLRGRTVGVSSPGAPEHRLLAALLVPRRLSPADLSILSLGERGVASALAAGEIDAGLAADPWASRLLEGGQAVPLADFRRREEARRWLGGPTVDAALFAAADTQLPPAALTALARALLRATKRVETADPEALRAPLPAAVAGLPEDFRARVAGARGIYLPGGWVRFEAIRRSLAVVRSRAPLPKAVRLPRFPEGLLHLDPLRPLLQAR